MNASVKRVVITDFVQDDLAIEREVLAGVAEVEALGAQDEAALAGAIDSADALMVYHNVMLSAGSIDRLKHCQAIVRCGVGFDNVDHARARARGIPVVNVPDYGTEEVADSAIGLLLALTRGLHQYNHRLQRSGEPWSYRIATPLRRLRGRVLGIVGFGRIGSATARRAQSLGMDVRFYDPLLADGYDKVMGVRRAESLQGLLSESFAVSLHCPLTEQTHHLIDATALSWMSPGGYLVNTARGGVVDTAALPEALASGRLAGAGLDVLPGEPPSPDDPLLVAWRDPNHPAHERLILNPHAAFYSEEGFQDMRRKGAEACRRSLTGQPLRNVVNAASRHR